MFKYNNIHPDSVQAPRSLSLDMDKLPSKSFAVNDFRPLQAPVQQTPFNLDQMPDSSFNLEAAPAQSFRLQQFILPAPTKVKAGTPKLMPNTTTGVLQFSTEEGLPGINITASLADSYGNIWLATEKGLCMYDGDNLFIYSFLNKNAVGGDYSIAEMTLDKEGNIWIATGGDGIYIINITTNIVKRYACDIYFSCIISDKAGMMWASSFNDGLFVIDPARGTIKNIRHTKEPSNENSILAVTEDQYKNIWLGYLGHVAIVNNTRKHIKQITSTQGLIDNAVLNFLEDSRGDMWVAVYGGGINVISLKNKTLGTINEKNGFDGMATELAEDSKQQIWMMRRDTCYVLNNERTAIKQIMLDIKMLTQNNWGSCLKDRNGNIWLGTIGKGVVIIDTKGPLPEHLSTKEGLADNSVWGMMEDKKGNIWLSTRKGINIYDPEKSELKLLGTQQGLADDRTTKIMEDNTGNIFINSGTGFSLLNIEKKLLTNYPAGRHLSSRISKCIADTGGLYWLSTYEMGIILFDRYNNNYKTINKGSGLLSDINWDMIRDQQGNFWIASDSGITVLNPNNNTVKYLRDKDGLCDNVVFKILQHSNGDIWAGTVKGISIINADNFTITNITRKEGLVPQEIYDMAELNGSIYAGSSDGLIAVKKITTGENKKSLWRIINYGKREGFPYNDYNQNTGMVTRKGQSWWGITPVVSVVTQEPLADTMLPKVNITGINIMDQPLSFATWSSISNHLKATDTLWNETKTTFYLKNTLPEDSGYLSTHNICWDSITPGFKLPIGLTLPYDQNSVNFSFNNTDIKGREKIMYRYILEGADKTWSDFTNKNNTRNYFNLPAGSYTFRITSKGFSGLWSKEESYSFSILPPWWKTWWAYVLYIIAGITIVGTYARYRGRQLIEKNLLLEDKINQRTAELSRSLDNLKATQTQLIQSEKMASLGELTAGIAHEIQNPLNFVNNFSEVSNELLDEMNDEISKGNYADAKEIAADVKQNLAKINHHGKRADAIVKGMLQHSRRNNAVKEPTDINALCDEYLRLSYHGLRAKDKSFNASFKTDFDKGIPRINVVPQDLGRVILNLINNAFYAVSERKKQNEPGYDPTVTVSTALTDNGIEIKVKDNGNGIPKNIVDKIFQPFFTTKPTGQGTGLGLSLSYDIVKAHGGELKVETEENKGTSFIIQLPLSN